MGRARLGFAIANQLSRFALRFAIYRSFADGWITYSSKVQWRALSAGIKEQCGKSIPDSAMDSEHFSWSPTIIRKPANQGNGSHQAMAGDYH
jgi:hypothetical protein